jgi:aspartyl/asparaginyl beta-hydroxylase (cupin superfamily)
MESNYVWLESDCLKELEDLYNNRNIIKNELLDILNTNLWPEYQNNVCDEEMVKIKKYEENEENSFGYNKKSSWRLFPILLNGQKFHEKLIPNTHKLLSIFNIRGAAFSALEPGYCMVTHNDKCDRLFKRVMIPLLIPKNNNEYKSNFLDDCDINGEFAVLKVENEYRLWKDSNYFAFNQHLEHSGWNFTKEMRVVLIIDLL